MGHPQGGKLPSHYDPSFAYEQAFMMGMRSLPSQPLRPTRCRYCGGRYSEKSLKDARCENCGATL